MNQRIKRWISQTSSFYQPERESHSQDLVITSQVISTTHIGSDEIGLTEKVRFKGSVEFSFNLPEPVLNDLEFQKEKRKQIIKAETRNGSRNRKERSSTVF